MGFGDHRLLLRLLRAPVAITAIDTALRVNDSEGSSVADPPELRWHIRAVPGAWPWEAKAAASPLKHFLLGFPVCTLHFTQPRIQIGMGHPPLSLLSVSIKHF